ncbi:MAG: apolipoprotein N-acyltransferase [Candidatus Eiseniibacteriota bacterium]
MDDFRFRRLRVLAKGAFSGLVLSFAFPPLDLTFLAFVGLVPVLWTLEDLARAGRGRPLSDFAPRAFLLTWTAAATWFAALLWWIVLLDAPALTIPWVRYPGTALIVGYLALYFGVFGVAYTWVRARTGAPAVVLAPALWVVAEVSRGYWELGFPWGHLGYSQVRFLPALQMASVTGIHGVTAWIVAVNVLLLGALRPERRRWLWAAAVVLALGVPIVLGAARLSRPLDLPTVRVALVQPNIGNAEKWDPELRDGHFQTLAELSRRGVEQGARLVAWPETAAPTYLLRDAKWRPFVEGLARELGVPLFCGFPDYQVVEEGGARRVTYTNSGALIDAAGELAGRMDKMQLVPFGERMPFSGILPFLDRVDFGEADFLPGEGPVLFEMPEGRFGSLVCFEAIYPDLVRRHANGGAELLVNITNDSWFGAGTGARQHADMAVTRCVETGCGMARAANSGISLGADPLGRTFGETALFTRDVAVVDVPLRRGRTLYCRFGDWASGLAGVATGALVVGAFLRRRG